MREQRCSPCGREPPFFLWWFHWKMRISIFFPEGEFERPLITTSLLQSNLYLHSPMFIILILLLSWWWESPSSSRNLGRKQRDCRRNLFHFGSSARERAMLETETRQQGNEGKHPVESWLVDELSLFLFRWCLIHLTTILFGSSFSLYWLVFRAFLSLSLPQSFSLLMDSCPSALISLSWNASWGW